MESSIHFFSGGESHVKFISLFDQEKLLATFKDLGVPNDKDVTVYGEAYGGSQQGMSHTYGKALKFIVFDVQIDDCWLSVPDAEQVAKKLGLEFVHYIKISTDLKSLDVERDACSVQSVRNGVTTPEDFMAGKGKKREGVVLRPLIELTMNNGERVICKHKGDEFKETATPRPVVDPAKAKVMDDANAIANEWVTKNRLEHILQKLPTPYDMTLIPKVIVDIVEDVLREAKGEIIESETVKKAIGRKSVEMFKDFIKSQIKQ